MSDYTSITKTTKQLITLFYIGLNCLLLSNCQKKREANPAELPAQGVNPTGTRGSNNSPESREFLSSSFYLFYEIVEENCMNCHNSTGLASGADFSILQSEADWVNSDYIQAGSPTSSSLYYRLTDSSGDLGPKNMPTGGALSSEEINTVAEWITKVSIEAASTQSVTSILEGMNGQINADQANDACTIDMPPQRIWRITRQQYLNIIEDVFNLNVSENIGDLSDPSGIGLATDPANTLSISSERMNTIFNAIEETSERLLANPEVSTCIENTGTVCVDQFIDEFGPILWRRPLSPDEKASLSNLFSDQLATSNSRQESMRLLLEALLISAEFWYRDEIGIQEGGIITLDDHELAEFLAFTIWDSIPDAELHSIANEQRLSDPNTLNTQIRRMATDPKGLRGIRHFIDEWLDLSQVLTVHKDSASFPEFSSTLRRQMWEESMEHINLAWNENASVLSLFANDQFIGPSELGSFYEAETDSTGTTQHPPNQRMGILTSGAFLSAHSKAQSTGMPLRGSYFLEEILCSPLPPVPADISADAASGSFTTTREFFENTHANRPECSSCHTILDPIGASFENYDPVGRYRTMENGYPIDASGSLNIAGEQFVFQNAIELVQQAVTSPKFSQCLIDRYLTYALGWHLQETNCLTTNSQPSSELKLNELANFLERVPALQNRSQPSNPQEL